MPDATDDEFEVISSEDRVFHAWGHQSEGATLDGTFNGISVGKFGDEATVIVDGKLHIFPLTVGLSALKSVTLGSRVRILHLGLRKTTDGTKSYRAFEIAVARAPEPASTDGVLMA